MSCVFVVDAAQHPRTPVHPGAARRLLTRGQAAVWRRYPVTIILEQVVPEASAPAAPLRLKIDPGSKTTGLALVDDATGQVVWAGEVAHRGQRVRDALLARQAIRRGRRQRHTRYRPQRFENRRRPKGWLPPSLESRLANVLTWVARPSARRAHRRALPGAGEVRYAAAAACRGQRGWNTSRVS
jgi:RRXRR protein